MISIINTNFRYNIDSNMTSLNDSLTDDLDIEMSSDLNAMNINPSTNPSINPSINASNPSINASINATNPSTNASTNPSTNASINPSNQASINASTNASINPSTNASINSIAGSDVQSHISGSGTVASEGVLPSAIQYDDYYNDEYDPQNTTKFNPDDIERIGAVQYTSHFKAPLFLAVGKGKRIWLHRDYVPDLLIVKFFEHEYAEYHMRSNHVRTDKPALQVFTKPRIFGQHHLTVKQVNDLKVHIRTKRLTE